MHVYSCITAWYIPRVLLVLRYPHQIPRTAVSRSRCCHAVFLDSMCDSDLQPLYFLIGARYRPTEVRYRAVRDDSGSYPVSIFLTPHSGGVTDGEGLCVQQGREDGFCEHHWSISTSSRPLLAATRCNMFGPTPTLDIGANTKLFCLLCGALGALGLVRRWCVRGTVGRRKGTS